MIEGPPFYDEDEWTPDGPTLHEMLGLHYWHGGIVLSPFQLELIKEQMIEEYGRHWKAAMNRFIEDLTPFLEHAKASVSTFNSTINKMAPMVECIMPPKPPKNGPQWNPHARNGKGGRRR